MLVRDVPCGFSCRPAGQRLPASKSWFTRRQILAEVSAAPTGKALARERSLQLV
jgi:hypothetical protein